MQNLENKIKSWYRDIKEPKISFEKKGINPTKDWNKIIFLVFFVICVLGGLAFYFYTEVDKGTFFTVPEEELSNEVKINNTLLKKIIDDVNARENTLIEIRSGKKTPANPSI